MTDIDTDHCDYPTCPHCGHEHEETWEFFSLDFDNDGDTMETQCDVCDKAMIVTMHIEYSFSTTTKKEEER
jgi:hypothetical protein